MYGKYYIISLYYKDIRRKHVGMYAILEIFTKKSFRSIVIGITIAEMTIARLVKKTPQELPAEDSV